MTASGAFQALAPVIAVSVVLLTVLVIVVKAGRDRWLLRHAAMVERVRPTVLAQMEGDEPVQALRGRRGDVAEQVAASLLPKLRGADRDALAALLEEQGVLAEARRRLGSRSAIRRLRALELLGAAGDAKAATAVTARLHDRDADVRGAAARALGRLGDPAAVTALLVALHEGRVPANTVSMAILRIGPGSGPPLVSALRAPRATTRSFAAELLGTLGVDAGGDALEALLSDPDTRTSAARALGRLGRPERTLTLIAELEAQLAAGSEADGPYTVALVTALGQIGDRRAIPALTASLARTHRLSFAAAGALAGLGPRRSRRSERERSASPVTAILVERRAPQLDEVAT